MKSKEDLPLGWEVGGADTERLTYRTRTTRQPRLTTNNFRRLPFKASSTADSLATNIHTTFASLYFDTSQAILRLALSIKLQPQPPPVSEPMPPACTTGLDPRTKEEAWPPFASKFRCNSSRQPANGRMIEAPIGRTGKSSQPPFHQATFPSFLRGEPQRHGRPLARPTKDRESR